MKISNLLKLSSLAFTLCMTFQLQAADVDLAAAQHAAKAFLNRQVATGRMMAPAANNLQLAKAEPSVAKPDAVDYYIFNADKSYVVIAGDDQAPQVLMYGEEGRLDMNNIPPAMQWLLNKYKYQIDGLKAGTHKANAAPMKSTTPVAPLVKANWDQSAPYNNQCPTSGGSHAVTGCPATSLAMCYYKWKWPETFPAVAAIDGSSSGGLSAPALPERAADWDNIIDEYTGPTNTSYTTAQANAVAWLMRYAGQAIPDYQYSTGASGANDPEIYQGVLNMGYTNAQYLLLTELVSSGWSYSNGPQQYTDAQWNEFMLNELYNDRPIEYLAYDVSYGFYVSGHAFNVFGCDANGKYYVNWGWSGDSNGYCTLHNFTTNTGATGQAGSYVFNYGEAMIIGIEPPYTGPTITASPNSVTFDEFVGDTYTQAIEVRGHYLENNITATLTGSDAFSIDVTTIATQSNGSANGTITISYSPNAAGTHTATLTLKSSPAETVTVPISATATMPPPTIIAKPKTLSFGTAYTNTDNPLTLNVKGVNLNGDITATLTDQNGVFALSATTITQAEAAGGKDITVTFNPKAAVGYTGSIKLTSNGATTVTVALSGSGQLFKATPVLLPANDNYIENTAFRADWTDETPMSNIASYTLRVKQYIESDADLLIEETFAKFTSANNYSDIGNKLDTYMDNPGWTGSKLFRQLGAIRVGTKSYAGTLTSPALDMTDSKGKMTVKLTMKAPDKNNPQAVITCGNASQTIVVAETATDQMVVLDVPEHDNLTVTISSTNKDQRFDISRIEIYSGDASGNDVDLKAAAETGDATMRTITGITNRYYVVNDLLAGATYNYWVRSLYVDGTESRWSKVAQVTLGQSGGLKGDIDGNGTVDITDVNLVINIILGKETRADYMSRADMDGNGTIDITDVNPVITIILGK